MRKRSARPWALTPFRNTSIFPQCALRIATRALTLCPRAIERRPESRFLALGPVGALPGARRVLLCAVRKRQRYALRKPRGVSGTATTLRSGWGTEALGSQQGRDGR